MVVSGDFPFVDGKHGNESQRHVQLKGLAVYWLLQKGFNLDEIDEEFPVEPETRETGTGDTRYIDIRAKSDESEIFIECQLRGVRVNNLSMGGKQVSKRGSTVFVFGNSGIYRLKYCEVEHEDYGISTKQHTLERVSSLPMLDLSAYDTG